MKVSFAIVALCLLALTPPSTQAQGRGQAALGGHALDGGRVDEEMGIGEPLPDRLLQIVNHRATGRGDQRDPPRKERQRPLPLGAKSSL